MRVKRVLAAVLVGAVMVGVWLLLDPVDPVDPVEPIAPPAIGAEAVAPAPPPVAAAVDDAGSQPAVPLAQDPAPAPERREVPVAEAGHAVVRGRCVDAAGFPLAGCAVRLHGWRSNQQRLDRWLVDHADGPAWEDPPAITTAGDGRFRFAFWPPPPFQFSLQITRDGHGAVGARWSELGERSETDAGDVVLPAGVRVTGRVVDESGAPHAKAQLRLQRQGRIGWPAVFEPRWGSQAVTKEDGTFAMHHWLTPGAYELHSPELELLSPKTLTLAAERPDEQITVVAKRLEATATISGRVLDETGAPVSGVQPGRGRGSRARAHGVARRRRVQASAGVLPARGGVAAAVPAGRLRERARLRGEGTGDRQEARQRAAGDRTASGGAA